MSIFEILQSSKSLIKNTEAEGLKTWGHLKATKPSFEFFLSKNIVCLESRKKNEKENSRFICTSYIPFIRAILSNRKEKLKFSKMQFEGIPSYNKNTIKTWDLEKNSYITLIWKTIIIFDFLEIKKENALVLNQIFQEIQERNKNKR